MTEEHQAFEDGTSEKVSTVEFDYESVDVALGFISETPKEARAMAAELCGQLLAWCFGRHYNPHAAMVRFVAAAGGLRPDLQQNLSFEKLADALGVTKQALCHQSRRFQAAWGIKFSRSRSKVGREHMAAARLGGPNRNPKKGA